AAPGAYHSDVPINAVNVAPPTMVFCTISFFSISSRKSLTGILFHVALLMSGIIVVSPCPPMTIAFRSAGEAFNLVASWYLKRDESNAPPIPIILFLGNPATWYAKYVIVSIGLETTRMMISGEYFTKL